MKNDGKSIHQALSLDSLWASTEDGISQYMARMSDMRANMGAFMVDGQAPAMSSLLSIHGGVGVIQIKGPIRSDGGPFDQFFGVTSYPAIQQALVQAASSPDVKSIMLDIASPGGAVSGISDTAELIRSIDTIKPVAAHTIGDMCSAAYWLGSSARTLSASKTSIVGSIGVVYTHIEESKALADAGITVTVLREGQFKALASPFEPLTETAKDGLKAEMRATNAVFVEHVAQARGKTPTIVDQTMGQGRVFVGEAAKAIGLIDEVQTFGEAMAAVLIAANATPQHPAARVASVTRLKAENPTMNPEQLAAAAALGAVVKTPEELATEAAEQQASADAQALTEAAAAAEATRAAELAASMEPAALQAQVASLTSAVTVANAAILRHAVAQQIAEDKLSAMTATVAPLQAIVEQSLATMHVALGHTPLAASAGRAAETVLAEHALAQTSFNKVFKVGGVAAAATPADPTHNPVGSIHRARLNAVGNQKGAK